VLFNAVVSDGSVLYLQIAVASLGVATAAAIPLTAYFRRPLLKLRLGILGYESRLEGARSEIPWFRLIASTGRFRRSAKGSCVLVDRYVTTSPATAPHVLPGVQILGYPTLGWTSSIEGTDAVVVFSGSSRLVDFGQLSLTVRSPNDPKRIVVIGGDPQKQIALGAFWSFQFLLAMHNPHPPGRPSGIYLSDLREFLPPNPGGYSALIVAGADDSRSKHYLVTLDWDGQAATPIDALISLSASMSIRAVSPKHRLIAPGRHL
jgi:hypothetical protein